MKLLNPSGSHIPGSCSAGVSAAASLRGHPGRGCQHHGRGSRTPGTRPGIRGGSSRAWAGLAAAGAASVGMALPGCARVTPGQAAPRASSPVCPLREHPLQSGGCSPWPSCCWVAVPTRVPLGGQHAGVSPALSPSCPVTFVTGGCLLLRVVPVPCWLRVPGGTRGRSTRPQRAGPPRVLQLRLLCMQACGWQLSTASCLCRAIRICRCLRCLTSSSRG